MEAIISNIRSQVKIVNMLMANVPFIGMSDQRSALARLKQYKETSARIQKLVDRFNNQQLNLEFHNFKMLVMRYERSLVLGQAVQYDTDTIFDYMQTQLAGCKRRTPSKVETVSL